MNKDPLKSRQNVELLNHDFGKPKVKFIQVAPTLIKAVLNFAGQASAEIHLQGAHLSRWLDTLGRDNIFTSPTAVYKSGIPIRGGNPIIFPQFGSGEICQHGFARNSVWRILATEIKAEATIISLELKPEDIAANYREQWQHDFVLSLTISLGQTLRSEIKVHNPNPYPLSFTLGFHTYLAVDDINSTEISGFSGLEYMDNLRDRAIFREDRENIGFSDFIDRRYQNVPADISIHDKSTGRLIQMQTKNCRDAFVWNPWQEAEKKLADLAPQSYQKFICVEPGNMKTAIVLDSRRDFIAEQEIKRIDGA